MAVDPYAEMRALGTAVDAQPAARTSVTPNTPHAVRNYDPYREMREMGTRVEEPPQPTTVEEVTVVGQRPKPTDVPMVLPHDHSLADRTGSGIRGGIDALTLGGFPYLAGAVRGAIDPNQSIAESIAREKKINKEAFAANPYSYGTGEVAGTVASMFVPGLDVVKGGQLLAKGAQGSRLLAKPVVKIGEQIAEEAIPRVAEEAIPRVAEEAIPRIAEEAIPRVAEEAIPRVAEATIPKVLPTIAGAAGRGATYGGIRGATGSETWGDVPSNIVGGATIGGLTGGGLRGAGYALPVVGTVANKLIDIPILAGGKGSINLLKSLAQSAGKDLATPDPKMLASNAGNYLKSLATPRSWQETLLSPEMNLGRVEFALGTHLSSLLGELTGRSGAYGAKAAGRAINALPQQAYGQIGGSATTMQRGDWGLIPEGYNPVQLQNLQLDQDSYPVEYQQRYNYLFPQ